MDNTTQTNGVVNATETTKRGRGRPRIHFTKQVTFVKNEAGEFVPRGKGKPAKNAIIEIRNIPV